MADGASIEMDIVNHEFIQPNTTFRWDRCYSCRALMLVLLDGPLYDKMISLLLLAGLYVLVGVLMKRVSSLVMHHHGPIPSSTTFTTDRISLCIREITVSRCK